jgi:phage repressor protein C with HTH and peptisase S24 domain
MDNKQNGVRIRLLRQHLNKNQEEFASAIGYNRSYISNIEKGRTPVTERLFLLIEQAFGANPEWLRSGLGEMFKNKVISSKSDYPPAAESHPFNSDDLRHWQPGQNIGHYAKEEIVLAPVYNEADAGEALRNYSSPEPIDWVPVKARWLSDHILLVRVRGDSMEANIPDGSVVFVDMNQKDIIDGKAYLLEVPYIGATVKRVYIDYQKIILKPDNPMHKEKVFPFEALERDELRIIGRVIRVITTEV